MLYDYLIETFGFNEPIFITDIDFNNYSKIWISKELARLCESNQIVRYEKGIYYIPQDTIFGKSSLNPNKVIKRKYLSDNGNSIGFFTGTTALQQIGLSTQMPNIPEIQTNNESSKLHCSSLVKGCGKACCYHGQCLRNRPGQQFSVP